MLLENHRISLEVILCDTSKWDDSSDTDSLESTTTGDSSEPEEEEVPSLFYAVLGGSFDDDNLARPAILVRQRYGSTYIRENPNELYCVHTGTLSKINPMFAFHRDPDSRPRFSGGFATLLRIVFTRPMHP